MTGEPTPFAALKVIGYVPAAVDAGVPAKVLVAGVNAIPLGSVPDSANVGVGIPVAATVNESALPIPKIVADGEVMAGLASMTSVNDCVAAVPMPLVATK